MRFYSKEISKRTLTPQQWRRLLFVALVWILPGVAFLYQMPAFLRNAQWKRAPIAFAQSPKSAAPSAVIEFVAPESVEYSVQISGDIPQCKIIVFHQGKEDGRTKSRTLKFSGKKGETYHVSARLSQTPASTESPQLRVSYCSCAGLKFWAYYLEFGMAIIVYFSFVSLILNLEYHRLSRSTGS